MKRGVKGWGVTRKLGLISQRFSLCCFLFPSSTESYNPKQRSSKQQRFKINIQIVGLFLCLSGIAYLSGCVALAGVLATPIGAGSLIGGSWYGTKTYESKKIKDVIKNNEAVVYEADDQQI